MRKPKISIIAAIGRNRELGKDNKLLWHIPEDLKRFKKLTEGHVIIMGRKTFESIGKPLPKRLNIIISRHRVFLSASPPSKGERFSERFIQKQKSSFEEALKYAKDYALRIGDSEIFIIGGGQVYQQAIKIADKLYLTIIDKEFPQADTFFPDYSDFKKVVFEKTHQSGGYRYKFVELER